LRLGELIEEKDGIGKNVHRLKAFPDWVAGSRVSSVVVDRQGISSTHVQRFHGHGVD
jgi:hypothetical protein